MRVFVCVFIESIYSHDIYLFIHLHSLYSLNRNIYDFPKRYLLSKTQI